MCGGWSDVKLRPFLERPEQGTLPGVIPSVHHRALAVVFPGLRHLPHPSLLPHPLHCLVIQFHTLARFCADTVVGTGKTRSTAAWLQTYRALAHGFAKNACSQAHNKGFPPEILGFADAFVHLQRLRHDADYDPSRTFKRYDVISMIERAERVILGLAAAPRPDLRAFVALVLLPERR